ncbi:hypothetical protein MARBORIA2_14510 [Methanobrevibacter arboriphilus]|uniref:hypothetical protein n=1 Tax=Methanobrevibacter arboriphilus TaxID=39441 RepID=UPI0022EDB731|nr:hypothetical protein [Methanobrevibacter arboriphilus]GLI12361.1 hypothetical protein MARBORIA2_14510 [Methanobrevibacter arboriphilus]
MDKNYIEFEKWIFKKYNKFKKWVFKYISSKIDITKILIDHIKTLKNNKTKRRIKDLFTFFIIPLIFALVIVILFNGRLSSDASNSILLALSIFAPIMFSLLISIYSINRKRLTKQRTHKIVKEFKNNVSFILVLCLLSLFFLIIDSLNLSISFLTGLGWLYNLLYSIIIIYLLGVIGLTLLQVLKRWNELLDLMLEDIKPDEENIF